VPDTRPWLAGCDVVAVPLRHGGGTRLKILEALAAGCPVVSTAKGAEGLDVADGCELLLAETPGEIGAAIVRCLRDPQGAAEMGLRGRALVEARYSWAASAATVQAALARLGVVTAPAATGAADEAALGA
jgi:polysaccharide biosynthesis protein PslH